MGFPALFLSIYFYDHIPAMTHYSPFLNNISDHLEHHILPFWMNKTIDATNGGFIGALDNQTRQIPSEKTGILNTRILWTFAASYRVMGNPDYLQIAGRAYQEIINRFIDPDHLGIFWSLKENGSVHDDRKHIYTQAFAIYGLSEYYLASNDPQALTQARKIYNLIENNAFQHDGTGYHEAFSRDWQPLSDTRLGGNDIEADRTFNTHLHLLEAYTNLYRAWPDPTLHTRLRDLVDIHFDRMYHPDRKHILSYFDANLKPVSELYSYGHDIEAAWLIYDAVAVLNDPERMSRSKQILFEIANQTLLEGCDSRYGGIFDTGKLGRPFSTDKQWWAQSEALTGFTYAWLLSDNKKYADITGQIWDFIDKHVIDHEFGEWYFLVDETGKPFTEGQKAGPWKCPYHTARTGLFFYALTHGIHDNTPFSIFDSLTEQSTD